MCWKWGKTFHFFNGTVIPSSSSTSCHCWKKCSWKQSLEEAVNSSIGSNTHVSKKDSTWRSLACEHRCKSNFSGREKWWLEICLPSQVRMSQGLTKFVMDMVPTILKRSWILLVVLKSPWIQFRSLKSTDFFIRSWKVLEIPNLVYARHLFL